MRGKSLAAESRRRHRRHRNAKLNGLDTTRQLLEHDPHFKVIVLSITDSGQVIREALAAGARGFVRKSAAARDLVSAVEALQNKRMFFTPRVNDLVLAGFLEEGQTVSRNETPKLPTLTAREREITQLLAERNSSKEVASLLNPGFLAKAMHRLVGAWKVLHGSGWK